MVNFITMRMFSLLVVCLICLMTSKTFGQTTDNVNSTSSSSVTTSTVTSSTNQINDSSTSASTSTPSSTSTGMMSSSLVTSTQQMTNGTTRATTSQPGNNITQTSTTAPNMTSSSINSSQPMSSSTSATPTTTPPPTSTTTTTTTAPPTTTPPPPPPTTPITTTTMEPTTTMKPTTTTMKPTTTTMKPTTTTMKPTTTTMKPVTNKVVGSTVVPETMFGKVGLPLFLITFAALLCVLIGIAIYYFHGKRKSGTHYLSENGRPGGNVEGGPMALQMEGIDYGANFETIDLEDERNPTTENGSNPGLLSFKNQDAENETGSKDDVNSISVEPPSWLRVEPTSNEDTTSNFSTQEQTDEIETKPEVQETKPEDEAPADNNETSENMEQNSDIGSVNSSAFDESEFPPPLPDVTDEQKSEEFKTEM